jgi:hypothetical protein
MPIDPKQAPRPRSRGRARVAVPACLLLALAALAAWLPTAFAAQQGPPQVSTGGVSHIRGTSAELEGTVYPHGLATTYFFQYGPTTAYGSTTPQVVLPAATSRIKVGQVTSGLQPGYHYRIVGFNAASNGLARVGKDRVFDSKSRKLKFSLPKSLEPIAYRQGFTLNGKVTGNASAGVGVVLQETPYPFLGEFQTVSSPVTTNSSGGFSFRVPSLTTSADFRVITTGPRPQFSGTIKQAVTPIVVLRVRHSSAAGIVRLYGTISPSITGAHVLIQLSKPARAGNTEKTSERTSRYVTQFSTVAVKATKSVSRFSVIVKVTHSGRYRAYVSLRNKPLQSGGSNTVSLHAGKSKRG